MPIDKWTLIDIVTAILNLICFNVIGKASPESILNPVLKSKLDIYVIIVLVLSWLRFFSYFLVIEDISKVLLTLYTIIKDVSAFFFINMFLVLIFATIFMGLFQGASVFYYNIYTTFRTLYDALIGNWAYNYMSD